MKVILFLFFTTICLFSQVGENLKVRLDSLCKEIKYNQVTGEIINNQDYFIKIKDILTKINPRRVVINVHTDSSGKAPDNLEVSKKVANEIKSILSRLGYRRSIIAVGKGEVFPVVLTPTRVGRYQNRRVEIELVK